MRQSLFLLTIIIFVFAQVAFAKADDAESANIFYGNLALVIQPFPVETITICVSATGEASGVTCRKFTKSKKAAKGVVTVFEYEFLVKEPSLHIVSITVDGRTRGYTINFPTKPKAKKKTDKKFAVIDTMTLSVLFVRELSGSYPLLSLDPHLGGVFEEDKKVSTDNEEEISFDMDWRRGNCGIPNSQGVPVYLSFHPVPNLNQ